MIENASFMDTVDRCRQYIALLMYFFCTFIHNTAFDTLLKLFYPISSSIEYDEWGAGWKISTKDRWNGPQKCFKYWGCSRLFVLVSLFFFVGWTIVILILNSISQFYAYLHQIHWALFLDVVLLLLLNWYDKNIFIVSTGRAGVRKFTLSYHVHGVCNWTFQHLSQLKLVYGICIAWIYVSLHVHWYIGDSLSYSSRFTSNYTECDLMEGLKNYYSDCLTLPKT